MAEELSVMPLSHSSVARERNLFLESRWGWEPSLPFPTGIWLTLKLEELYQSGCLLFQMRGAAVQTGINMKGNLLAHLIRKIKEWIWMASGIAKYQGSKNKDTRKISLSPPLRLPLSTYPLPQPLILFSSVTLALRPAYLGVLAISDIRPLLYHSSSQSPGTLTGLLFRHVHPWINVITIIPGLVNVSTAGVCNGAIPPRRGSLKLQKGGFFKEYKNAVNQKSERA